MSFIISNKSYFLANKQNGKTMQDCYFLVYLVHNNAKKFLRRLIANIHVVVCQSRLF